MSIKSANLRITEIFFSLQGESKFVGYPTVFVRLTGCPLRCSYCDSEYAFFGGEQYSLASIIEKVNGYKAKYVCVTGGEPLAQPNCIPLLESLCDNGLTVSLETSGAMDISKVDTRVSIVLDLKTPGSGEMSKNVYSNIELLKNKDQVKFVNCDRGDYEWAKHTVDRYSLMEKSGEVLFSPSFEQLDPKELADWIVQDSLRVRFQTQLHKQLWGDTPGV